MESQECESTDTRTAGSVGLAAVSLVANIGLAGWWAWYLVTQVPRYKRFFMDLGVELPRPTQLVLSLSDLMHNAWFVLLPGLAMLICVLAVAVALLGRKGRGRGGVLLAVICVVVLGAFAWMSKVACELPIRKMYQALATPSVRSTPLHERSAEEWLEAYEANPKSFLQEPEQAEEPGEPAE